MRVVKLWWEKKGKFVLKVKVGEAMRVLGFVPRSFTARVLPEGAVEVEFFPDGSGAMKLWSAGDTVVRAFDLPGAPRTLYAKEWVKREGRAVLLLRPVQGVVTPVAKRGASLFVRVPLSMVPGVDASRPVVARLEPRGERELAVEFIQP